MGVYRLILHLIIIIVVSSCSSKFSINKRRYLKGYHVDFVKNSKVKTKTSEETSENKFKTYPLAKKIANKNNEVSIATTELQQLQNKPFLKLLNNKKDTRILHPNNYLCNTSNKRIISNNIIRPLINKYQTPNVSSKSQSASDGGGILAVFYILSAIGSVIALVYMFIIIASALLAVGVPMAVIGVLVGIAVLILLGIGVLLYLNKD